MPLSIENDRKTNVDVLESNKTSNKEEIRRLRDENKELRQKAAHLSRVSTQHFCNRILVYFALL